MDKKKFSLIIIAFILGLMLAIQYNSINGKKTVRDTRSQWELRDALLKEKATHSRLLNEIRASEEKLSKYKTEWKQSKEQALYETVDELKSEIGLTNIAGHGIVITIDKLFGGYNSNFTDAVISPELLQKLLNELNMYGAKHISISEQRIINSTVIRDINGETKIDGFPLRSFPIEIKAVTNSNEEKDKLYNRMLESQSLESLYIDNLQAKVSKPESEIEIPAYVGEISVRGMEPVKSDKGGN